jgi:hypothetical protein
MIAAQKDAFVGAATQDGDDRASAVELTERISTRVTTTLRQKIESIQEVTRRSQIMALNASIEAARAGTVGKGFAIIAEEMREISCQVDELAKSLRNELVAQIGELRASTRESVEASENKRFMDLSLTAIELIDRNLYERSCDVRWWATDAAIIDCAAKPGDAERNHAASRLGVILNAYTVYLDIWLCDVNGRVLANGRPDRYPVQGIDVSGQAWFKDALQTSSGDGFVCADVATNAHMGGSAVATYAAAVREGGKLRGRPTGVLGVHFDWAPQAQAIVSGLRLSKQEWANTRAMLLDRNGRILAASDGAGVLAANFPLRHEGAKQGAYLDENGDRIGFALTPGYETYKGMGWFGCIVSRRQ